MSLIKVKSLELEAEPVGRTSYVLESQKVHRRWEWGVGGDTGTGESQIQCLLCALYM